MFHIQPSIFNNLHSTTWHQNNGESTLSNHTPWKCCSNWLSSWIRRGLRHLQHFGLSPRISNWRSKERWHFSSMFQKPTILRKKKKKNPPEPPATFGEFHLPRFRIPFAFPIPSLTPRKVTFCDSRTRRRFRCLGPIPAPWPHNGTQAALP